MASARTRGSSGFGSGGFRLGSFGSVGLRLAHARSGRCGVSLALDRVGLYVIVTRCGPLCPGRCALLRFLALKEGNRRKLEGQHIRNVKIDIAKELENIKPIDLMTTA